MCYFAVSGLVSALQHVPYELTIPALMAVGQSFLTSLTATPLKALYNTLSLILSRLDADHASLLTKTSDEYKLLQASLHAPPAPVELSVQLLALDQVNRVWFEQLPNAESQQGIVSAILDMAGGSTVPDVVNRAHKTLKGLKLETEHVKHEFTFAQDPADKTVKGKKNS